MPGLLSFHSISRTCSVQWYGHFACWSVHTGNSPLDTLPWYFWSSSQGLRFLVKPKNTVHEQNTTVLKIHRIASKYTYSFSTQVLVVWDTWGHWVKNKFADKRFCTKIPENDKQKTVQRLLWGHKPSWMAIHRKVIMRILKTWHFTNDKSMLKKDF